MQQLFLATLDSIVGIEVREEHSELHNICEAMSLSSWPKFLTWDNAAKQQMRILVSPLHVFEMLAKTDHYMAFTMAFTDSSSPNYYLLCTPNYSLNYSLLLAPDYNLLPTPNYNLP